MSADLEFKSPMTPQEVRAEAVRVVEDVLMRNGVVGPLRLPEYVVNGFMHSDLVIVERGS